MLMIHGLITPDFRLCSIYHELTQELCEKHRVLMTLLEIFCYVKTQFYENLIMHAVAHCSQYRRAGAA